MNVDQNVLAGQAFYSRRNLSFYDLGVLGISNSWIWKCPTQQVLQLFNDNVSANHLDVGVGTGFYLDRGKFPTPSPRLVLMDLNSEALAYASARIKRYSPETHVRNALEPIAWNASRFDSISVNYLLHCVPGDIRSKAVIFDHLAALMNPGGVCFGSTLLQGGVERGWAAKKLMKFYNQRGIFSNERDKLDDFESEFRGRFENVRIQTVGCAVLFSGSKA